MESIKEIFGANIKCYRKKLHLSQEQLAEKLGITQKHLSTIETGTNFVSAELLEKFTQQLYVSASALFYSINEIPNDESFLCKIDQLIDSEYEKASNIVKTKIRYIN